MTIREMHIEINLAAQQVASAVNRRFLPEEIDWVINKTIERFVKGCVKPKEYAGESDFEEYQIDTDKIRTLVAHDIALPLIVSGNTYSAILPANYAYLIQDSTKVVHLCGAPMPAAVVGKQYLSILKFNPSGKQSGPYYTDFTLKVNNINLMTALDIPTGITSKDSLFEVIEIVRDTLHTRLPSGVTAYWERYGTLSVSNALILASDTPLTASLGYDSSLNVATVQELDVLRPAADETAKLVVNRLSKSDRIGKLQQSSFSKSRWFSPISVMENNILKVYGDNSFLVTQVLISYVRKARKVSLSLNRNCDLPEETHQEICDQAVEYFKMTIQDPGYQAKLQDNKLRN